MRNLCYYYHDWTCECKACDRREGPVSWNSLRMRTHLLTSSKNSGSPCRRTGLASRNGKKAAPSFFFLDIGPSRHVDEVICILKSSGNLLCFFPRYFAQPFQTCQKTTCTYKHNRTDSVINRHDRFPRSTPWKCMAGKTQVLHDFNMKNIAEYQWCKLTFDRSC